MTLWEIILLIIILVILVIVIYNLFFVKHNFLVSGIIKSSPGKLINSKKLPKNNTSNYAIAIWFFIEDWDTNFGAQKDLFALGTGAATPLPDPHSSSGLPMPNAPIIKEGGNRSMKVVLDANENDLLIGIKTFKSGNPMKDPTDYFSQVRGHKTDKHYRFETFRISNIDIQKWVCLIISVNGRNLDVYLHGKLIRSFILPGVPASIGGLDLELGSGGKKMNTKTFKGNLGHVQIFNNPLNPQEAYNIYREGLASNYFDFDYFNKYKMKIQFYEYNDALGSPLVL